MRVHFAIIFSLICGTAMADEIVTGTAPTTKQPANRPVSIGRPHSCVERYPNAALAVHAEGTTTLSFTITTDGTVKDIKIIRSSNNKDLDDAAAACAAIWLYAPATKDRVPVESPWSANVVWKIPDITQEAFWASECLTMRDRNSPIPPGVGATTVMFHVTAGGEMTNLLVSHSSGDKALDDTALLCLRGARYDTSTLTLPPEGLPGHITLDWAHALLQPPPASAPPK